MTSLPRINFPKRVFSFIGHFFGYMLSSLVKYWYFSLLLTALIIVFYLCFNITSAWYISGAILVAGILITIFATYRELNRKFTGFNIAYYGCYTITEGEYLTSDVDSGLFNRKVEALSQKHVKSLNVFNNKYIEIHSIALPKFLPLLFSYEKLDKYIKRQVQSTGHLAALYFLRDAGRQTLKPVFHFDTDSFQNTYPVHYTETMISELDEQPEKTVELGYMSFLLLFSTSLNYLMMESEEFQQLHTTITETERLIFHIRTLSSGFSETKKNRIINFSDYWEAYLNYMRIHVFIEQKEFLAAAQKTFKAIKLNPFFPYESYETLRLEYSTRYALQLIPGIQEYVQFDNQESQINFDEVEQRLSKMISYGATEYLYELLNEILHLTNDKKISDYIEDELEKLEDNDAFLVLTKSEVIRYIPKGEEKINKTYAANMDKAIQLLKKAIEIDNDFTILKSKLGSLLLTKGVHYNNESIMDEGIQLSIEGMSILQELGVIQMDHTAN